MNLPRLCIACASHLQATVGQGYDAFGRPTGFAAVGLLQVRAFALIPFGDWLRQPCASLAQRTASARTSLIRPVLRQVEALAARRLRYASACALSGLPFSRVLRLVR